MTLAISIERTDRSYEAGRAADPLVGQDILCFSHDWNSDPLSKTHFMRLLARQNRVLWINSIGYRAPTASRSDLHRVIRKVAAAAGRIREVEPNIFVLNPLVIPAYGRPAIRALSQRLLTFQVRRAMRRLGFHRAINWVFNPAAGLVAGDLGEDRLIYHCVDEYSAFRGVSASALADLENRLLLRANPVIVSSERLYRSKAKANARTFLVRHGVDHPHFRRALDPATVIPAEIARLPRPVIGYFGLIADDWVDADLLGLVADRFSSGSLVLLGKCTMDITALARRSNVHVLGRKPYSELPSYCKGFDVALIPFPMTEVTLNANPLKAREYVAAGLPVVSTAIPEVTLLKGCRIGADAESFVQAIEEALVDPGPSRARSDSVAAESWQARLDEIRGHLAASWGAPCLD